MLLLHRPQPLTKEFCHSRMHVTAPQPLTTSPGRRPAGRQSLGPTLRPTKRRLPRPSPKLHCADGIIHPFVSGRRGGGGSWLGCWLASGAFAPCVCTCRRIAAAAFYRCSGVSLGSIQSGDLWTVAARSLDGCSPLQSPAHLCNGSQCSVHSSTWSERAIVVK
jgi:hypothetical protein